MSVGALLKGVLNSRYTQLGEAREFRTPRGTSSTPQEILIPRLLLIGAVFFLTAFGLMMIFSASSIVSISKFGTPFYYLQRQAIFLAIGVVACVISARLDYHLYLTPLVWLFWAIAFGMLVYVRVKGFTALGAQRWLDLHFVRIQPSEFAKITVLLLACALLSRYHRGEIVTKEFLVSFSAAVFLPVVLIFIQPDLGTSIIIVASLLCLFWMMGMPFQYMFLLFLIVGVGVFITIITSDFRYRRLAVAFNPWIDPQQTGYQQIQGLYALASGGILGVGLGNSRQKFSYLPEAHTDFISAIIGEELGLVGMLIMLMLFVILVYAGLQIALRAPDLPGKLIACGATSIIAVQAGINLFCVVGLFPVTGKPLPFLSYGGSSIISCMILVGLLLSVSRQSARLGYMRSEKTEQRKAQRAQRHRDSFSFVAERGSRR